MSMCELFVMHTLFSVCQCHWVANHYAPGDGTEWHVQEFNGMRHMLCIRFSFMSLVRVTLTIGSPAIGVKYTINMSGLVGWPFLMSCMQAASKLARLLHLLALLYAIAE